MYSFSAAFTTFYKSAVRSNSMRYYTDIKEAANTHLANSADNTRNLNKINHCANWRKQSETIAFPAFLWYSIYKTKWNLRR